MSQKKKILDYMRAHGSITQAQAFLELGCSRLPARIWDLKRDGYNIKKTMHKSKNRWGEPTEFASYSVVESEEKNDG